MLPISARPRSFRFFVLDPSALLCGLTVGLALILTSPEVGGPVAGLLAAEPAAAQATAPQAPAGHQPAIPVIAQKVTTSDIHQQILTSGEILPMLGVDLFPKINGQIVRFDVTEGSRVDEGDLVAEIDHRIQDTLVEQALAAVDMQEVMVKRLARV